MRTLKKLFWVLLAGSIVGIGYNIWFWGVGYRIWFWELRSYLTEITSLHIALISVSWGWLALTAIYPIYLLRRNASARARSILLHVLAVIALVGVFNPGGIADVLDLSSRRNKGNNWVFGISAAYLTSFAYWRFIPFIRARNK